MSSQQKTPEEIQAEIDTTREDLGDTAEALAGKADVKGQAKAKVDEGAQQLVGATRENPVQALAGAFTAGVLVGWVLSR